MVNKLKSTISKKALKRVLDFEEVESDFISDRKVCKIPRSQKKLTALAAKSKTSYSPMSVFE